MRQDERFKKNITPLTGAVDQLLRLKGVTFEWKEPEQHGGATGSQMGFIAQEVEKVYPSWVRTGQDGFKALSVAQVEALEVESIRELKIRLDAQDKVIKELQESRRPLIAYNPNWGIAMAGLIIGGAVFLSRRKRSESDDKA